MTPLQAPELAAVLLAAGSSSRLGEPKQLVDFRGETLLRRTLRILRQAGFAEPLIVLGASAEACRQNLGKDANLSHVHDDWHQGLGASLSFGTHRVLERFGSPRGILVALCDQPFLEADHFLKLRETFQSHAAARPVATAYRSIHGVPAIFPATSFAALMALQGEQGARRILAQDSSPVAVAQSAAAFDIDTPEDLASLEERTSSEP